MTQHNHHRDPLPARSSAERSSTARGKAKPSDVTFDPWIIWIAFRKHWGWCIPLGCVLASGVGLIVWKSIEPEYQATHLLEANRDYIAFSGFGGASAQDIARNESQLVHNRIVLDPVLANPELRSAPSLANPLTAEQELKSRMGISNAGTDRYLIISYRDKDPEAAAKVCNAIVESYQRVRGKSEDQRMISLLQMLNPVIEDWRREVENHRQNIADLTKSAKGYDPFKQTASVESSATKLIDLRGNLAELEAEELVLTAQLSLLKQRQAEAAAAPEAVVRTQEISPFDIQRYINDDGRVRYVRAEVSDRLGQVRMIELQEKQHLFAERYQRLKDELKVKEAELAQAEEEARGRAITALAKLTQQQRALESERALSSMESQLASVTARREAFERDYQAEKSRIEEMGGETADLFFAREDYEQSAAILGQLNNRLAVLRTEQRRSNAIQSVSEATPPTKPIGEIPLKKIGLYSFAVFLLPFGIALLLELRFKRVVNSSALEQQLLVPVLGEISRISGGPRNGRSHRMFEESVDSLRTNLMFKMENFRTIAVTSSMPSEGKSSVASQLAISLAKNTEETVLLIDADVRSPDLHDLFGLDVSPGLCAVLKGEKSLDEAINKSLGDFVHLLPAGRLDGNPHNLLSTKNLQSLIDECTKRYRYVVIDTAPVLPAAETLGVTALCDSTLVCAMRDVSRTDHVSRALRRLDAAGANIVGTVFSGVPASQYAYRYGDYRYNRNLLSSSS